MDFKHESATARVRYLHSYACYVSHVRANFKGQGHGTELMYTICRWADEQQALLYLEARVFESHGIPDNKSLQAWYERFGFVREHSSLRIRRMVRYPSQKIPVL